MAVAFAAKGCHATSLIDIRRGRRFVSAQAALDVAYSLTARVGQLTITHGP
jgi:diphthamide biosynthesis methyltransferase